MADELLEASRRRTRQTRVVWWLLLIGSRICRYRTFSRRCIVGPGDRIVVFRALLVWLSRVDDRDAGFE